MRGAVSIAHSSGAWRAGNQGCAARTCCRLAIREGSVSVAVGFTWNGRLLRSRRVPFHVERCGRRGHVSRPFHEEPRRREASPRRVGEFTGDSTATDAQAHEEESDPRSTGRRAHTRRSREHPGARLRAVVSRGTGRARTRAARRRLLPTDRRAATRSAPTTQTSAPPESPLQGSRRGAVLLGGREGRGPERRHVSRGTRPSRRLTWNAGPQPRFGDWRRAVVIRAQGTRRRGTAANALCEPAAGALPTNSTRGTADLRAGVRCVPAPQGPRRTRTRLVPWEGECTVRSAAGPWGAPRSHAAPISGRRGGEHTAVTCGSASARGVPCRVDVSGCARPQGPGADRRARSAPPRRGTGQCPALHAGGRPDVGAKVHVSRETGGARAGDRAPREGCSGVP